jgi:hypothetical protein
MFADQVTRFLDPGFLEGLSGLSLEEVRGRRMACSETEVGLSYLRRLVQGRLDIVMAEVNRRLDGGEPVNVSELVDQLPRILGDHTRAPGPGRLATLIAPAALDDEGPAELERIVSAGKLAHLGDVPPEALAGIVDQLNAFEREVSLQRRQMHDVLDRLQEEVVRRYKSGEATVDGLLG